MFYLPCAQSINHFKSIYSSPPSNGSLKRSKIAKEVIFFHHASINYASELLFSAGIRILRFYLVFEGLLTLVAVEISVVEGLNYNANYLFPISKFARKLEYVFFVFSK